MQTVTVDNEAVAPKFYEWGAVKWVIDDAEAPGTRQSFGVVYIHPGKTNPAHWHTTAQEVVHMLQGECDIRTDDGTVTLRAGQTLFIPDRRPPRADEPGLGARRLRLLVLGQRSGHAVRRPGRPGRRAHLPLTRPRPAVLVSGSHPGGADR